jgi:hypothetical protein
MTGRLIVASAVMAVVAAEQSVAVPLLCRIDQKFACGSHDCGPVSPGSAYNRIEPERGTFARCDDKGCDEYPAKFTRSGLFTNIEIVPGALAKLSYIRDDPFVPLRDLQLLEVVTTDFAVLVSYGTCSEVAP